MKLPEWPKGETSSEGGGTFAKFDDKTGQLFGVLRGEPVLFQQHWVNGRSSVCGEFNCALCDAENPPSHKARFNIITEEGSVWVAKIYEFGRTVFDQIKALADEGYALETTRIKIQKSGSGLDTAYSVMPAAKALTDQEKKLVASVPLKDIRPRPKSEPGSNG